jgi:hypothetical protein
MHIIKYKTACNAERMIRLPSYRIEQVLRMISLLNAQDVDFTHYFEE